ncbi:hypothetical protein [Dyadobacter sp. 32]|uniref:hypothetical protein n=1 Tax=Dyadobacter sp. 32 TaxID=538966 RepID=UPI0039C73E52
MSVRNTGISAVKNMYLEAVPPAALELNRATAITIAVNRGRQNKVYNNGFLTAKPLKNKTTQKTNIGIPTRAQMIMLAYLAGIPSGLTKTKLPIKVNNNLAIHSKLIAPSGLFCTFEAGPNRIRNRQIEKKIHTYNRRNFFCDQSKNPPSPHTIKPFPKHIIAKMAARIAITKLKLNALILLSKKNKLRMEKKNTV